jgi:DHA1 family bicyclomycin/chloramphenicol resistance-like MFS transporter
MLPALGVIATDLAARDANDRQLVLTAFFAGLSLGLLVFGPVSDATGRKPALYAGIALFVLGGLCCALASSFGGLLAGRVLSGFGAAGPRIVAIAVVRDRHAGRAMARVMSFVTTMFILVPVLAPALGQAVLLVASWRTIFWLLLVVAAIDVTWFALRQPETLAPERRRPLSLAALGRAFVEVFRSRITLGYTLATGFVFGALINYLTTSQQLFQEQYGIGKLFPVVFGALVAALGVASLTNARLVMRFGMQRLARLAGVFESVLASLFLLAAFLLDGHPPLWLFMACMLVCFFCNGVLFGNYNARALEPMGHIAGVAAAITGSLSQAVALAFGAPMGHAYDGTVLPIIGGFVISSIAALSLSEGAEWLERKALASRSSPAARRELGGELAQGDVLVDLREEVVAGDGVGDVVRPSRELREGDVDAGDGLGDAARGTSRSRDPEP